MPGQYADRSFKPSRLKQEAQRLAGASPVEGLGGTLQRSLTAAALFCVLCLALAGVAPAVVRADVLAPSQDDSQICRAVRHYLVNQHLSKHPLDDEMSARCFDIYLESLDPMKSYFTKADIGEFKKYQTQIDDQLAQNKIPFAYVVFNRFLQRIDEKVVLVNKILSEPIDFTLDEEIPRKPKDADYAASGEETDALWRKRIKYDLLVRRAEKLSDAEAMEKVRKRYTFFAKRMKQIDSEELREIFLTSLTSSYDPHSAYMSASTNKSFQIKMSLELDGIGAELKWDDGAIMVHKVIEGGAAGRDGRLKPGDRITSVGQNESGEMVVIEDMKLTDAVDLIRGKRGTKVRLEVVSAGETDRKIYVIERDRIELKDEEARGKVFTLPGSDGREYKVGVIVLPSFYMDMQKASLGYKEYKRTTTDMEKILEDFKKQSVDAVVVDLRNNGGGSLEESIDSTGLFIDKGPVVQVREPDSYVRAYDDETSGMVWAGPLVVLVSKTSASASEIFAGAIQDYHRGIIVGDEFTHGKGTVQSVYDLREKLFGPLRVVSRVPDMGTIKLTTQQFYLPSGRSTQLKGVASDIVLPSIISHFPIGESDLDHTVNFDQIPSARFRAMAMVDSDTISALRKLSADRVNSNEEFRKESEKIARYEEQKSKAAIPLNEQKFNEERSKFDSEKEEGDKLEEAMESASNEIQADHFLNETLAISADYVRMLRQRNLAIKD